FPSSTSRVTVAAMVIPPGRISDTKSAGIGYPIAKSVPIRAQSAHGAWTRREDRPGHRPKTPGGPRVGVGGILLLGRFGKPCGGRQRPSHNRTGRVILGPETTSRALHCTGSNGGC